MPTAFKHDGFRFFFFSNEGDPREPPHVHVGRGDASAKFWLVPKVELAHADGLSPRDIRTLALVIRAHDAQILRCWNDFFEP